MARSYVNKTTQEGTRNKHRVDIAAKTTTEEKCTTISTVSEPSTRISTNGRDHVGRTGKTKDCLDRGKRGRTRTDKDSRVSRSPQHSGQKDVVSTPTTEESSTSVGKNKAKGKGKVVTGAVHSPKTNSAVGTAVSFPRKDRRRSATSANNKKSARSSVKGGNAPEVRTTQYLSSSPSLAQSPLVRHHSTPAISASLLTRPTRDHAYAGPTFSNSPAPSTLPIPDFLTTDTINNGNSSDSGVPSLSPSSSTTSLPHYDGCSAPPSPTRLSSSDFTTELISHDGTFSTGQKPDESLRLRSLQLLDLLRGTSSPVSSPSVAINQSANNTDSPYIGHTMSLHPGASVSHNSEQTGLTRHSTHSTPTVYQHNLSVHRYPHQLPQAAVSSNSSEPTNSSSQALLTEIYSNGLRALLKLDACA